ncbi:hypothetical protein KFK09_001284 [Dendrobium nobile]|uniref:Uncharacterized protein n=1 Tax=Dendrobium nobile TaxID=94219 RepID=A0A8T3CAG5_DENNO|nr:hypothetical protein KFK09_001284 [Dendrobium nobile]
MARISSPSIFTSKEDLDKLLINSGFDCMIDSNFVCSICENPSFYSYILMFFHATEFFFFCIRNEFMKYLTLTYKITVK